MQYLMGDPKVPSCKYSHSEIELMGLPVLDDFLTEVVKVMKPMSLNFGIVVPDTLQGLDALEFIAGHWYKEAYPGVVCFCNACSVHKKDYITKKVDEMVKFVYRDG